MSNSSKQTQEPWFLAENVAKQVFSVHQNGGRTTRTIASNLTKDEAQLIVAAQKLLDALDEIVQCEMRRRDDLATISKRPDSLYQFSDDRVQKALSAISAAKGE